MARIERATSPLPRECSTTELHGRFPLMPRLSPIGSCCRANLFLQFSIFAAPIGLATDAGAGEGNRTLVVSLEGFCSTIELHPRRKTKGSVALPAPCAAHPASNRWLNPVLLVEGEGFEPSKAEPADLQSAPFDRSGTPPNETRDYLATLIGCQTAAKLKRRASEGKESGGARWVGLAGLEPATKGL
jgi:hypothetical protein